MKPTEQMNWDAAKASLLEDLKPGQEIIGVELPVNQKRHVVQFLTIAPEGHPSAGRIIDITYQANLLLNSGVPSKGFWKGGAQLDNDRHGSVIAAIAHAVEMLGHFLYGSTEAAGFTSQRL